MKLEQVILDETNKLNEYYRQIGELYYRLHMNDPEDALKQLVTQAYKTQFNIASAKQEIENRKQQPQCQSCGAYASPGAAFCRKCGTKLAVEQPIVQEQQVCAACQAAFPAEDLFCNECGHKVGSETPAPVCTYVEFEDYDATQIMTDTGRSEDTAPRPSEAEYIICSRCGENLPSYAAFCTECGNKIK